MPPPKEARCFKCRLELKSVVPGVTAWEQPYFAVEFRGRGQYGSTRYDHMDDGLTLKLYLCDECLQSNPDLFEEIKK